MIVVIQAVLSPWRISATAIRESADPTQDPWFQAWHPLPPNRPEPSPPYNRPDVTVSERDVWIQRRLIEPPRSHGGHVGASVVEANPAGVATLPGNLSLKLEKVGLWIPGDQSSNYRFFHPQTGEIEPTSPELARVPAALKTGSVLQPALRLVFSGSGARLWDGELQVFDGRTRWPVADQESLLYDEAAAVLDLRLTIWHDTPLKLMLSLPCGEPEIGRIPAQSGEQLVFPSGIRYQHIAQGHGKVTEVGRRGEAWDISPEPLRFVLGRVGPAVWAAQCRFRDADEPVETPHFGSAWFDGRPRIQAAHLPTSDQPIELVCYTKRAHVWFEIAHLPVIQNPRSCLNLFTAKIPTAGQDGTAWEWFSVAAQAVQLDPVALSLLVEDEQLVLDQEAIRVTQLLKQLRQFAPGETIQIQQRRNELLLATPPSRNWGRRWWDRLRSWGW